MQEESTGKNIEKRIMIKRKTNKRGGREKKRAKVTKKQCRSMEIYKQEKRKERMNSE